LLPLSWLCQSCQAWCTAVTAADLSRELPSVSPLVTRCGESGAMRCQFGSFFRIVLCVPDSHFAYFSFIPTSGGAPCSYKWVRIPLTIDISPINHTFWFWHVSLSSHKFCNGPGTEKLHQRRQVCTALHLLDSTKDAAGALRSTSLFSIVCNVCRVKWDLGPYIYGIHLIQVFKAWSG
jgi:hypothetical protein